MSTSLAFSISSGAVGGGVGAGMPLCLVPVFGDKHCCGGNVWKAHSTDSEWGRLCFLCASSREAVIHRPSTAKLRPKERAQIPLKMILMVFKRFSHFELRCRSGLYWIIEIVTWTGDNLFKEYLTATVKIYYGKCINIWESQVSSSI